MTRQEGGEHANVVGVVDQHVLGLQGFEIVLVSSQSGSEHVHAVGLDGQQVPGLQGVGDSACVWAGGWRLCL